MLDAWVVELAGAVVHQRNSFHHKPNQTTINSLSKKRKFQKGNRLCTGVVQVERDWIGWMTAMRCFEGGHCARNTIRGVAWCGETHYYRTQCWLGGTMYVWGWTEKFILSCGVYASDGVVPISHILSPERRRNIKKIRGWDIVVFYSPKHSSLCKRRYCTFDQITTCAYGSSGWCRGARGFVLLRGKRPKYTFWARHIHIVCVDATKLCARELFLGVCKVGELVEV